jgi:hypothetical protein
MYAAAQIILPNAVINCANLTGNWRTITMKLNERITAALLASAFLITLSACEEQGPFEEAGDEIGDAIDDAGDAIDDAF